MYSIIGSSIHSRPLNSLEHCVSGQISNLVPSLRATAKPNDPSGSEPSEPVITTAGQPCHCLVPTAGLALSGRGPPIDVKI